MGINDHLLSAVKEFISPEFIKMAGRFIGESPEKTQSGFLSTIPTLLTGLFNKGSTPSGAKDLINLIQEDDYQSGVPANFLDQLKGGKQTENFLKKGSDAISAIFGNQQSAVQDHLTHFTGLNSSIVSKIMSLAAPLVMGVVGSKVKKMGLNPETLTSFLGQQKNLLMGTAPQFEPREFLEPRAEPLERKEARPTREPFEYSQGMGQGYTPAYDREYGDEVSAQGGKKHSAWPLLLSALVVAGGFLLFKGRNKPETSNIQTDTQLENREQAGTAAPAVQAPAQISEDLTEFLEVGSDSELPKRFTFDNLNFYSGSVALTPESHKTLNEIASALKKHPTAVIRLESFTDTQGDPEANQKLSTARAETVKQSLIRNGIDPSRVSAIGRGTERPTATNDTEEGRQANRRTELVVTHR